MNYKNFFVGFTGIVCETYGAKEKVANVFESHNPKLEFYLYPLSQDGIANNYKNVI
jgi:hypothetical protein